MSSHRCDRQHCTGTAAACIGPRAEPRGRDVYLTAGSPPPHQQLLSSSTAVCCTTELVL